MCLNILKALPLESKHDVLVKLEQRTQMHFMSPKSAPLWDCTDPGNFRELLTFDMDLKSTLIDSFFTLLEAKTRVCCLEYFGLYRTTLNQKTKKKLQDKVRSQMSTGEGYILVPVHEHHHWMLVVVDIERHTFIIYDSMDMYKDFSCRKTLTEILDDEVLEQTVWAVVTQECTHQAAADCGVFTCVNAFLFTAGCKRLIVPQAQARDMCAELRFKLCSYMVDSELVQWPRYAPFLWHKKKREHEHLTQFFFLREARET
jgi:Ulp1 protease family, C-terminal catalytic domain